MKRWVLFTATVVALTACAGTEGSETQAPSNSAWPDRATVPCQRAVERLQPGDPGLHGVETNGFADDRAALIPDPTHGAEAHFGKVGMIVSGGAAVEVAAQTEDVALTYSGTTARTLVFDCTGKSAPYQVFVGGFVTPTPFEGDVDVTIDSQPVTIALSRA